MSTFPTRQKVTANRIAPCCLLVTAGCSQFAKYPDEPLKTQSHAGHKLVTAWSQNKNGLGDDHLTH